MKLGIDTDGSGLTALAIDVHNEVAESQLKVLMHGDPPVTTTDGPFWAVLDTSGIPSLEGHSSSQLVCDDLQIASTLPAVGLQPVYPGVATPILDPICKD